MKRDDYIAELSQYECASSHEGGCRGDTHVIDDDSVVSDEDDRHDALLPLCEKHHQIWRRFLDKKLFWELAGIDPNSLAGEYNDMIKADSLKKAAKKPRSK